VCGDSSYVATSKLPRWNAAAARGQEVGGARGGSHTQSMMSNVVGQSSGMARWVGKGRHLNLVWSSCVMW